MLVWIAGARAPEDLGDIRCRGAQAVPCCQKCVRTLRDRCVTPSGGAGSGVRDCTPVQRMGQFPEVSGGVEDIEIPSRVAEVRAAKVPDPGRPVPSSLSGNNCVMSELDVRSVQPIKCNGYSRTIP